LAFLFFFIEIMSGAIILAKFQHHLLAKKAALSLSDQAVFSLSARQTFGTN